MPFFLITGLGGAAKSALVYELRRRGFDALDAEDVEGLTGWRNIRTGETLEGSPPAPVDFQTYRFAWNSEALLRLFSRKGRVFLCGSAWNARQFHPCFEHVFVVMPQKPQPRAKPGRRPRDAKADTAPAEPPVENGSVISAARSIPQIADEIEAGVQTLLRPRGREAWLRLLRPRLRRIWLRIEDRRAVRITR